MKINQSKKGWVYTEVTLDKEYDKGTLHEIGEDLINFIIERSKNGEGKDGKSFPKYSKEYKESLDFKIAGKSDEVNLTLSSELLDSLEVIEVSKNKIRIGYDKGDERNNAVAEGNIIGSYGKSRGSSSKARNYLDLSHKEVKSVLVDYPSSSTTDRIETDQKVRASKAIRERAYDLVETFRFGLGDDE